MKRLTTKQLKTVFVVLACLTLLLCLGFTGAEMAHRLLSPASYAGESAPWWLGMARNVLLTVAALAVEGAIYLAVSRAAATAEKSRIPESGAKHTKEAR